MWKLKEGDKVSNFKKNWGTMGYTLGFILAVMCWPVTLMLLISYGFMKLYKWI